MHFDFLAIGSGPAGQKAALQAARLGHSAAVVERMTTLGGVSIHTGTIPSKTLREAVIYLTGHHQRTFYGPDYVVDEDITMDDLMQRAQHVIQHQATVVTQHLKENGVTVLHGEGSFLDANTIVVSDGAGQKTQATADHMIIATGSEAARPPDVPFDSRRVLTSDEMLHLDELPSSLAIVGGGIIGTEYAGIFAALGIRVFLIDRRPGLLPFVDREMCDTLCRQLQESGVQLHLNEDVAAIDASGSEEVHLRLVSGRELEADAVLYAVGRAGATAKLNLAAAGLEADNRGRITVDEHFRTAVPHIYAAGDVIGNPALAATSMEQGRIAACHALDHPEQTAAMPLPYAIYTVPEIAMLGPTSEELDRAAISYVTGRATYNEVARGRMLGDTIGFLKMTFHTETGRLLGIHALGAQASELIHIGQAVIAFGGGLDYFVDAVFNYPTLAECYKTAALDAANELRRLGKYSTIEAFHPEPPVQGIAIQPPADRKS